MHICNDEKQQGEVHFWHTRPEDEPRGERGRRPQRFWALVRPFGGVGVEKEEAGTTGGVRVGTGPKGSAHAPSHVPDERGSCAPNCADAAGGPAACASRVCDPARTLDIARK